jgi:AcrR family transcriptional regulator
MTKRAYHSETRSAQAADTRKKILDAALQLFQSAGFDRTTISQLAETAGVSSPTVYSLFKSKRGVLLALIDEAMPSHEFQELVEQAMNETDAHRFMRITAKIARQMYDAERSLLNLLRSASVVSPELKQLEREREERRYARQQDAIERLSSAGQLARNLPLSDARDILWTFSGRDLYRLLVIERGWSSEKYEKWLADQLSFALLDHHA